MRRMLSVLIGVILIMGISGCGSIPSDPGTIGTPVQAQTPNPTLEPNDYTTGDYKIYFTYENTRDDVAYSDMKYTRYNYQDFQLVADRVYDFAENGGTAEEFSALDMTLYWELYYLYTMLTLAELEYTRNPNSTKAIEELDYTQALWYDAWGEYWGCMHQVAISEYSEYMNSGFYDWQIESFSVYDSATEGEDTASLTEENILVQKYYSLISIEDPDYDAIVDIYVKLVNLRNKLGKQYGYNDFAEYAYDGYYSRDYYPKDAQDIWSAVKGYFSPIIRKYEPVIYDVTWDLWNSDEIDCTSEAIIDAMELVLPRISNEAYKAFQYMVEYDLYDFERSDERINTGYTTMLHYYNEPYIINSMYGNYFDYTDTFHEFGHFLNSFYIPSDLFFGMPDNDLCELQSQGMEILFTMFYDDIFGPINGEIVRADVLMSIVHNIVDGIMYDEFQQRVFAEENLTSERVLEIYKELYEAYGYTPYWGYEYEWVGISHNFDYPFYYISYAVSAIPALELYAMLKESYADAVDEYMTIAAMDLEAYYYSEAIAQTSLSDPFDTGTIGNIAESISRTFAALIN